MKYSPCLHLYSMLVLGFPLLHACALFMADLSLRRTVAYLNSFSFQTNCLGWTFILTRNTLIGHYACRYLLLVMCVWFSMLDGNDTSQEELVFNQILHYVLPAMTLIYYYCNDHPNKLPEGKYVWWLGFVYPLCYVLLAYYISPIVLNYQMYQILFDNIGTVLMMWVTTETTSSLLEKV